MRFRMLARCALVLVPLLLQAQAQDKPAAFVYTATTDGPPRAQGAVTVSGIRWDCSATGCTASGPWPVPGTGACRALAQQVGPIRYYGHPGRQLSAADLAKCNAGVSAAATTSKPGGGNPGAAGAPAATINPAARPTLAGSGVNNAQLRQGMQLRAEHYSALQRARASAAEELRRREIERRNRNYADSAHGQDCDDLRRDVSPNATEICDGRDNNCNGLIDEGQTLRRYLDADGDTHGDPARGMDVCPADITGAARSAESLGGGWLVETGNDCDDANPERWRDCR